MNKTLKKWADNGWLKKHESSALEIGNLLAIVERDLKDAAEGAVSSDWRFGISYNAALKPWREVVTPHKDVASGRYQQAEFAADIWQVHLGGGTDEYRDPVEFFRRTYLTESLKGILVGAVQRLSNKGDGTVVRTLWGELAWQLGGSKAFARIKADDEKATSPGDALREDLRQTGDFSHVHPMPHSGQDVPDDLDARLVVLGIDHPYSKETGNAAEMTAKAILASRGNAPRLYQNTLVFLAADKTRLQDLDEAARKYLAWESILAEKEGLNLDPQQVKQAETQKTAADGAVTARLPETYQWLLTPVQSTPQAAAEWQALRLSGQNALAVRASKKLKNDELLITSFAATRLRMELDRVPLWRENHVTIKQLVEDFARYLYLPRLKDSSALLNAIRDGLSLITWVKDAFGFADSFDKEAVRYRGLRGGQLISLDDGNTPGLLIKPEIAYEQMEAERPQPPTGGTPDEPTTGGGGPIPPGTDGDTPETADPPAQKSKRFYGTVTLDTTRVGRDADRIAEEVISHLSGMVGATVKVTLEVETTTPSGAPDHVVRTVTENCSTLKFSSFGFEEE